MESLASKEAALKEAKDALQKVKRLQIYTSSYLYLHRFYYLGHSKIANIANVL